MELDMKDVFIPHTYEYDKNCYESIRNTLKKWKTTTIINNRVCFCGKEFNAGALACMAINAINSIDNLEKYCDTAYRLMEIAQCAQCNNHDAEPDEITECLSFAKKVHELFWKYEPFIFVPYSEITAICEYTESDSFTYHYDGIVTQSFTDRIYALMLNAYDLVYGIKELSKVVEQFNDILNICELKPSKSNLAKVFGKVYGEPYLPSFLGDNSITTCITYISSEYIGKQNTYERYSHMLFADFFEGLSVGHSIRKCEVCGKYFLAVNRLEKRYCSEECAAKAEAEGIKAKSRETSIANIYYRVTDSLNHKKNRNKISEEICSIAKRIAKDNYIMAKTDSKYAKSEYITEMNADILIKEATENIDEYA